MKIIHFADIHCREKDLDEIKKCCATIYETVENERPDLIINAGDTFDSRQIELDSDSARFMFQFHKQLAEIAPIIILIGTPSHDGKAAMALNFVSEKIVVVDFPSQWFFIDGEIYPYQGHAELLKDAKKSALISVMPTPTKQFFQTESGIAQADQEIGNAVGAILAGFGAEASLYSCPHILAGHFQVGGAYISETQQLIGRDIEISKDQIVMAKADVVCLGHIHLRQKIGDNIFYSGSIYRKDFGEMEEKGFFLHEIYESGINNYPTFIRTPTRKLIKIEADFTKSPIEELEAVLDTYDQGELKGAFVRCEFKVWQNEAGKLDKERIKSFFLSAGAIDVDVRLSRIPRETVRSERLLTLATLREKIREHAQIKKEEVAESILAKADVLETSNPDQIIMTVSQA